jgi:phosphoglycerate dehydrogenase-like enzyme
MANGRKKILVLPHGNLYKEIMSARAEEKLHALGEVIHAGEPQGGGRNVTQDQIHDLLPGVDAVLTTWGAPKFDAALLEGVDSIKIIAHAAGTIKGFIMPEVFDKGIAVSHAAAILAESVGEWALTVTLMSLRMAYEFNKGMHDPSAPQDKRRMGFGSELYYKRVGIVAASMTGRAFIGLLQPFHPEIVVSDPYLSEERAKALGVTRVDDLDELFRTCDIVSNHAPTTPETNGMIGEKQLNLLRDGALFVNTARAGAIDYEALTRVLQSGRINGALDVYPKEPLATDSPLRALDNVILSPHVAGGTKESRLRLGEAMVDEIGRALAGEPLRYGVSKQQLAIMA